MKRNWKEVMEQKPEKGLTLSFDDAVFKKVIGQIRQEAKKEVFDDIEPKINDLYPYCLRKDEFEELKKRHLSSSEDAVNNDFKKPCPHCKGDGEVLSNVPYGKIVTCPDCKGQGFIKS